MASYSVQRSKHATLAASTVDTVTLGRTGYSGQGIEISNWGSAKLYFTLDGSVPTVGADESYVVGGGGSLVVPSDSVSVKLISAAANEYSVQAL